MGSGCSKRNVRRKEERGTLTLDYNVIASGSTGNAVRIEDVMIDCGISFKRMKPELEKCKYLLITHTHSDHIKETTLNQIRRYFPEICIVGNYEIAQRYNVDIVCNAGYPFTVGTYCFRPFLLQHDALTYGYAWTVYGNEIIYATDTGSFDTCPYGKYDYLFMESNYDEHKTEQMKSVHAGGYSAYLSSTERHASRQQAKAFYYCNRRDADSKLIELHKSGRFY